MDNIFYVYELVDPRDGLVFYVGKGKQNRFKSHWNLFKNGKPSNNNWDLYYKLSDLYKHNLEPLYNFPHQNLDEDTSYKLEAELVDFHGLQNLTNLCPGGRGGIRECVIKKAVEKNKNRKHSEKTKKLMSEIKKGITPKNFSDVRHRQKSNPLYGIQKTQTKGHYRVRFVDKNNKIKIDKVLHSLDDAIQFRDNFLKTKI